jgi:hypothetical protein
MKKAGTILLGIAALSLFGALISAGRDTNTAGGRFMGALILGGIGLILLYFGNRKGDTKYENGYRTTNQNNASSPQESYWQKYKRCNPIKASAIESITGRNMAMQSDKDAQELVSSLERWAKNIGCDIQNIKTEYLKSFKSAFGKEDIKNVIEHLKNVKYTEEANHFHISQSNTCTYFMIQWLTEDLQRQSTKSKTTAMQSRNRMSARDLVASENASLQFVQNPNTGKIFFVCGSKKGYVSPAAMEKMEEGSLDDFYYVEVSFGGRDYVPCLCYAKTKNVTKQFSVDDATTHDTSSIKDRIRTKLRNAFHEFIEDTKKEEAYKKMEAPFKYLTLKAAVENFYQQMQNDKSLAAMTNLYQLDYKTLLDEECLKMMKEVDAEFFDNTDSKEETTNKPDDVLPF